MKKMVSMLLALVMILSLPMAASAKGTKSPEKPKAPAKEETTAVTEEEEKILFPLMEELGDAKIVEAGKTEQKEPYWIYSPADEEFFFDLIQLASLFGTYARVEKNDADMPMALFTRPGTDLQIFTVLNPEEDYLLLVLPTQRDIYVPTEEYLQENIEYFSREITLPSGKGDYVFPQFYAATDHKMMPFGYNTTDDSLFDGAACWTEQYSDVTMEQMEAYLDAMILCGFDIFVDGVLWDKDSNEANLTRFHLYNGDAEVCVDFDAKDNDAVVYYKPKVTWRLLDKEEYVKYILTVDVEKDRQSPVAP